MSSSLIAAWPMYDLEDLRAAHDQWWLAIARRLSEAGVRDVPQHLNRSLGHTDSWRHPYLLLGQACEYPLARSYGAYVRLVATPCYTAAGCEGARYRSAVIVRSDDPATSLRDLRGRRCVANEVDSNSGMNLLRSAVAEVAGGSRFFGSVSYSGSHLASLQRVAEGAADVAAIDCVSFAHFARFAAGLVDRVRVLVWTATSPALPYITARSADDRLLTMLRAALADAAADRSLAELRSQLLIGGFDLSPDPALSAVRALEQRAVDLGYPNLQ